MLFGESRDFAVYKRKTDKEKNAAIPVEVAVNVSLLPQMNLIKVASNLGALPVSLQKGVETIKNNL